MLLSLFANVFDARPDPLPLKHFGELAGLFADFDFRDDKDGPLYSPTEFRDCQTPCPKAGRDGDCGGGQPHRLNENALRVHFGVLDFDDVGHKEIEVIRRHLDPYQHIWHTTYSHPKAAKRGLGRYRAIVALSRPVEAEEWHDFWPRMVARFGSKRDDACKDLARFYYLPAMPPDSEGLAETLYQPGIALDVGQVLTDPRPPFARPKPKPVPVWRSEGYTPTPWAIEWANGQLDRACAELREIDDDTGPMTPDLNRLSFSIGGLTPHLLDPEAAGEKLLEAALHRNPDRALKYIPTIAEGIEDGAAKPFTPEARYRWTDTGNAERIVSLFQGAIHYVHTWQSWLVWDGEAWSVQPTIQPQVKESLAAIREEAKQIQDPEMQEAAYKWATQSENVQRRRGAETLVQSEAGIGISHEALDAQPMLLGCANGILDLQTGQMGPPDPALMITKSTRIAYDPDATCPRWETFLEEIMQGNAEMVAFLRRMVGYCLTGSTKEQKLFFLFGGGANGKSTFVTILLNALGDYAAPGAPELLMAKSAGAHPTEQADLYGRRMTSCQEIEEGRYWNEVLLKQLTGSDPVKARRMNENFWTFTPSHKFVVSGNYKPNVRGTDDGIWRRMVLIPFEASFKHAPDTDLSAKLLAELPGILAWAVRGCLEWQRVGLQAPAPVTAAVEKYRQEQDVVGAFVDDRCIPGKGFEVTRAALRRAYETWCEDEGDRRPYSPKAFGNALRIKGFKETRIGTLSERGWSGLKLRPALGSVVDLPRRKGA